MKRWKEIVGLAAGAGLFLVVLVAQMGAGPGIGLVANNQQLKGLAAGQYTYVLRLGFANPGDAPSLLYSYNGTACAAADNGYQVQSLTAPGCWIGVFSGGQFDVRQWGTKGDGTTDDYPAIRAAMVAAGTIGGGGGTIYLPFTANGYKISQALNWTGVAGTPSYSLSSDPLVSAQNVATTRYLLHTTDTGCVIPNGKVSLYNISCAGNGTTSASATKTTCIDGTTGTYDTRWQNIVCSGYTTCFTFLDRTRAQDLSCDNVGQYPNLVNDYPSYCAHMVGATGNIIEVTHILGLFCRSQPYSKLQDYTGNGSTTFFDITINPTSSIANQASIMWSADSMNACLAVTTANRYPCVPLIKGEDFTLWDCGAGTCGGSGGTQLMLHTYNAATVAGNPQITLATTAGLLAGPQYKAFAEHNLTSPAYIVSVDSGTKVTLSVAPTSTNGAVKYVFSQVRVGSIGGSQACSIGTTPSCGHNFEVRLTTAPASGRNLQLSWNDPWSYVGIWDEKGAEEYFDVNMMGGVRTAYQGTTTYGNVNVKIGYWELGNYCAVLDEVGAGGYTGVTTGTTVEMGRNVLPPTILGTNLRCPIWFDPKGINNKLVWNSSEWRTYEGANTQPFTSPNPYILQVGSNTAPLNTAAGRIEVDLANVTCPAITTNLQFEASEDGVNFLAATNYQYHLANLVPSSAVYGTPVTSTGASTFPLSNNNLDTVGGYGGRLTISAAGLVVPHPLQLFAQQHDGSGVNRTLVGGGAVTGTPAALKAFRIYCGTVGGALLGQFRVREIM